MANLDEILRHKYGNPPHGGSADDYDGLYLINPDGTRSGEKLPPEDEMRAFSAEVDLIIWRIEKVIDAVQFRRQLRADGKREAFDQIVAQAPEEVRDYAEYSPTIRRNHPLVAQFAPLLGYDTPEKIDAFFEAASQIGV